jgi:hypothetical protein
VTDRVWCTRWPPVMVEPVPAPARRADQQPTPQAARPNPATPTEETTMRSALLYYLAQTWTTDRHQQAQREAPARAARRAHLARPSPRAPRARTLPAVVARRLRTALGDGRP